MDTGGRANTSIIQNSEKEQERKVFRRLKKFGEHLPKLRQITNEHLALEGLSARESLMRDDAAHQFAVYSRQLPEKAIKQYKTYSI